MPQMNKGGKFYFREITHSDGWNIADSTAGNGRISYYR